MPLLLLLLSGSALASAADVPDAIMPTAFRKLAGSSSSSSRRRESSTTPKPKEKEPTLFVYTKPEVPASCQAAVDATDSYLEVGNSDVKTNWNETEMGHASYDCLEPMIRTKLQYEKAVSYAWCVYPHCEEKCPGADCPVHDTAAKCQSAVKNWLGYAERKMVNADLSESLKYYDEAIAAWPENCGALGYRAELRLQQGNTALAKSELNALCELSACSGKDEVRETAATFWNKGRDNVPAVCNWAVGLDQSSHAASAHSLLLAWFIAAAAATLLA